MSQSEAKALREKFESLENVMHDAKQYRTMEEKIADMKRRGIDPNSSYAEWEDDEAALDADASNKFAAERKTPADLDPKAKANWDKDNGDLDAPPAV